MRAMAQIANDLSIRVFEAGNMADLGWEEFVLNDLEVIGWHQRWLIFGWYIETLWRRFMGGQA